MSIAKDLLFSQHALSILFSVTNKLQNSGDSYLEDLTIRQMLAVPAIIHAPAGGATINHIARQLGTTKQSTKQIINALEKKGYVKVAPSEKDKRALNITITPEGETAFQTCSERTDIFLADIFGGFTTQELETLCTLLEKLYQFDGTKDNSLSQHLGEHTQYNLNETEDKIMHYHQSYLKRRMERNEQI